MKSSLFEAVSGQQLERLAHIEFLAYFIGKVTRKDIMERFGVSSAAATRDLTTYIERAPDNITYDPRLKSYIAGNDFKCLLPLSADKCLSTLTSGFGDVMVGGEEFRCAHLIALENPDLEITATLSRAISLSKPVEIEYVSMSSGASSRVICPHSILNDGLRWHVRAYDRKRQQFSDFVLNRILQAQLLRREVVKSNEVVSEDSDWKDEITLILAPHPRLSAAGKSAIETEYRMENGSFKKKVRKAEVGYLLNSWNVDATVDGELTGAHIFLHLKNAQDLKSKHIQNFFLAPNLGDKQA